MITSKEITAVELSPTKKDFYQIWNELLDTARLISERWDPTSTNESDPGIVLLKVLTAVADKLNFNIDANTLEAMMPSAAQEESMRKLCDMMGYSMKYYQSATTDVKISYNYINHEQISGLVLIDKFTNIKDVDSSINFVTLDSVTLSAYDTSKTVRCMEGELIECETDDDNIISLIQLDDNNRYYFPETQVAENGIFVTNILDGQESEEWKKVDILNVSGADIEDKKVYKFGFDSKENLPYIQFPDDISSLIENGLKIRYLRTHGINGNVSVNTLCKMELPASWSASTDSSSASEETPDYYNVENYTVSNITASTDGRNIESINDAYNNYKKTIGTFDTLVTCRDYMNRIYQMTTDDTSATPLVSNVIVSDIRDDINKAYTLCTFTEHGIEYKTMARPLDLDSAIAVSNLQSLQNNLNVSSSEDYGSHHLGKLIVYPSKTDANRIYYRVIYNGNNFELAQIQTTALTNFDLVIYPFKNIFGLNTKAEYVKSFKYNDSNLIEIKDNLEKNKTISHNFIEPDKYDLACIKNYLRLKAKINTVRKVSPLEQADILGKVYTEVYKNFNMRRIDFGEEIPYDTILSVLEGADPRIKNVSLEEPTLVTKYCTVGGGEYETSTSITTGNDSSFRTMGDIYYNKLVLNNVLAGRIPLFNYNEDFKPDFTEQAYPSTTVNQLYPSGSDGIYKLVSECKILGGTTNVTLNDNEVVQFRLPNIRTIKTYPAYVNYFLKLNQNTVNSSEKAYPATFKTLLSFMQNEKSELGKGADNTYWNKLNEKVNNRAIYLSITDPITEKIGDAEEGETAYNALINKYGMIFTVQLNGEGQNIISPINSLAEFNQYYDSSVKYYTSGTCRILTVKSNNIADWIGWISTRKTYTEDTGSEVSTENKASRSSIYVKIDQQLTRVIGQNVDTSRIKYKKIERVLALTSDDIRKHLEQYFIPMLWHQDEYPDDESNTYASYWHTRDGLGRDSTAINIKANEEYMLQDGDKLFINYTQSKSENGEDTKTVVNEIVCVDEKHPVVIIKPNFDLNDSTLANKIHNYTKIDGFNFTEYGESCPGMFTLGADQQIELREFVEVKLDEPTTYIYWKRNDQEPDHNNRIFFNFDEEKTYYTNETYTEVSNSVTNYWKYLSYTLKSGEYFYYTNTNKTNIAYYGSGTKIKRTGKTPEIYKSNIDDDISTEDISTYGLTAAIPWKAWNFSDSDGQDKSLTIGEYQYINLTKGDVLSAVSATGAANVNNIEIAIDNDWKPIKSAKYKINDRADNLPLINFLESTRISWEVRSKLEYNVGPTQAQTLHTSESTIDYISMYKKLPDGSFELLTKGKLEATLNEPLSFKTNKLLQSGCDTLDVTTKKYADDGHLEETIADLTLKVFKLADIKTADDKPLSTNNFGNNCTKLAFNSDLPATKATVSLNITIPEGHFGLITIYNAKVGQSTDSSGVRFIKSTVSTTGVANPEALKIYNLNSWWTDDVITNLGNFGKIDTHYAFEAIEDGEFKTYTSITKLRQALGASGTAYARTYAVNNNSNATNYRNIENGIYIYTAVDLAALTSSTFSNSTYYGKLSAIGTADGTLYRLRKGLNVIELTDSGVLEIYPNSTKDDVVIFSQLDIIPSSTPSNPNSPLNPKLQYKSTNAGTSVYQQILTDIKKTDPQHNFYYNAPMVSSLTIDMNENDIEDTLENPLNLYSYNNINNKFVISEIDADYLKDNVVIAKASKVV